MPNADHGQRSQNGKHNYTFWKDLFHIRCSNLLLVSSLSEVTIEIDSSYCKFICFAFDRYCEFEKHRPVEVNQLDVQKIQKLKRTIFRIINYLLRNSNLLWLKYLTNIKLSVHFAYGVLEKKISNLYSQAVDLWYVKEIISIRKEYLTRMPDIIFECGIFLFCASSY